MNLSQLAVIPVLSFLLLVHELGHFIVARMMGIRVEEFGFGLPPRIWGFKRGEVIYSINWIPLGAFVRMTGENGEEAQDSRSFGAKGKLARAAVLVAGPAANFLAAGFLFAVAFMVGWPTPTSYEVSVFRITAGSPAEASGLLPGDRIVAVDGQAVQTPNQFIEWTRSRLGQPVTVTAERDGSRFDTRMTPRTQWPEGDGPIGLGLSNRALTTEMVSAPVWEAVPAGFGQAWRVITFTLSVPAMVIQGVVPADQARPSGPVGIYRLAEDAATAVADTGIWFPLIYLTAFISAGLALANMLPLPALDGGRLMVILVEAIRRRRISPEREGAFHFVGLMVLLALMIVVSYYDFTTPLPDVDWGLK
jgi:regulator of sigma E protease